MGRPSATNIARWLDVAAGGRERSGAEEERPAQQTDGSTDSASRTREAGESGGEEDRGGPAPSCPQSPAGLIVAAGGRVRMERRRSDSS